MVESASTESEMFLDVKNMPRRLESIFGSSFEMGKAEQKDCDQAKVAQLPKILHAIWVGDESLRPDKWLDTWGQFHPDWEFKLWGNKELAHTNWKLRRQMDVLAKKRLWNGVADLMRYEILWQHGGVYVDADTECLAPIDDIVSNGPFAAYENEKEAPGVIANSIIGAEPKNAAMAKLISTISKRRNPLRSGRWSLRELQREREAVWKSVGPKAFTDAVCEVGGFHILPSVSFYPYFHNGVASPMEGKTYARQHWGTTTGSYRSTGYVSQPDIPVNHWAQMRAIQRAIEMGRQQGADSTHIDALRSAYWSIEAKSLKR